MALSREFPHSFSDALRIVKQILSANHGLVRRGLVTTEAEQIVMAAFRMTSTEKRSFSRLELYTRREDAYPAAAGEKALLMAGGRAEGRTLQYLIGSQYFLNHEYDVCEGVLVPRPETEILVARAIEELAAVTDQPKSGLEIGLGSGAISVELLSKFSSLKMVASELTLAAANCARRNAEKILGKASAAERLEIVQAVGAGDVWQPFGVRRDVDFVVSNPPYLSKEDEIESDVLEHEPHEALFAPEKDVLHFYREIASGSAERLKPGGLVLVEMPSERAAVIAELFEKAQWHTEILQDLSGRDRVLVAHLKTGTPGRK